MSHDKQDHIARAHAVLAAGTAHRTDTTNDGEVLDALSDLACMAKLVGEIAGQYRWETAEWVTVGAHLQQAQEYATGLARCLDHAGGTLAFNSAHREPGRVCPA
jgi:hypothetical protein